MKDVEYYDSLPWEVQIERDIRANGSIYYKAAVTWLARQK